MKKKLSIITVNYKSSADIDSCLASMIIHEPLLDAYEIIIVDNNSGDAMLPELKNKYPFITILYAPLNGGFAYGNNYGIKHSTADVIFLLNPDTYLRDNSIEKLYTYLVSDQRVSITGPKLMYPDGRNQSFYMPKSNLTLWNIFCERFFLHRIFPNSKIFNSYFRTYMNYDSITDVEQVHGAALMFKRSVLDSIGLLDENYFMYFEESDWCFQAVKHGMKLTYFPESVITHKGGLSSEGNWSRSTRNYVSGFKYFLDKNYSKIVYYPALYFYLTGSIFRMVGYLFTRNIKWKYCYYQIKYVISVDPSSNRDMIDNTLKVKL